MPPSVSVDDCDAAPAAPGRRASGGFEVGLRCDEDRFLCELTEGVWSAEASSLSIGTTPTKRASSSSAISVALANRRPSSEARTSPAPAPGVARGHRKLRLAPRYLPGSPGRESRRPRPHSRRAGRRLRGDVRRCRVARRPAGVHVAGAENCDAYPEWGPFQPLDPCRPQTGREHPNRGAPRLAGRRFRAEGVCR